MTNEYPQPGAGDTVIIGPEAFRDSENTVISYEGENFYRGCGVVVAQLEGGGFSSCVKPIGHKTAQHEDHDGRVLGTYQGELVDSFVMPIPRLFPSGIAVSKQGIQDTWGVFVKPMQDAREPLSMEARILMAVLRTVANAMPDDEE